MSGPARSIATTGEFSNTAHAARPRDTEQAAGEQRRLNGGRARFEHAGEMPGDPVRAATSSGSMRWNGASP